MFGRKTLNAEIGLFEEPEEWKGPDKENADKKYAEKIKVSEQYVEKIRSRFFTLINPSIAASMSKEQLITKITAAVAEIVDLEKIPLNWKEQSSVAQDLLNDMVGVGPIEELLRDEQVTDILVNGCDSIFVERQGTLERTDLKFRDNDHVLGVARRIAASVGRRVDDSSPMVDARLLDGSRVNIITPPLSVHGTIISIRKFPLSKTSLATLVEKGSFTSQMAGFLEVATKAHLNVLISGGTGAGKTTLLNAMSENIRDTERVVTIEDAAEINLLQPHVISLETRQRNIEGGGEVSQKDLLRNALRMRPDRIIIGEVRGPEAHEMLQAMNTGHDGSMSTIHANSARDALIRLEDLLLSYQRNFQSSAVRSQIAAALDLVVHMARDHTGRRYVETISEVVGVEGDVIVMQDLFAAEHTKREKNGEFSGVYNQMVVRPYCEVKIKRYNLEEELKSVLKW